MKVLLQWCLTLLCLFGMCDVKFSIYKKAWEILLHFCRKGWAYSEYCHNSINFSAFSIGKRSLRGGFYDGNGLGGEGVYYRSFVFIEQYLT